MSFWAANRGAAIVAKELDPTVIRTIGPAPIQSLDDLRAHIEACDVSAEIVRVFCMLYVLVGLLKVWRRRVLDKMTLADVATFESHLLDRPLEAALWKLLRAVTGAELPVEAAGICVDLRQRGVVYQRGNMRRAKFLDCGLARFVGLAHEFESYANAIKTAPAPPSGEQRAVRAIRGQVIRLDPLGPYVYPAGKPKGEPIGMKKLALLLVLNSKEYSRVVERARTESKSRADNYLCHQLKYPIPESQAKGAPDALRRLVCDTNNLLTKRLGTLPEDRDWIDRSPGVYELTTFVTWPRESPPKAGPEVNVGNIEELAVFDDPDFEEPEDPESTVDE